jgi:hypothetical protein
LAEDGGEETVFARNGRTQILAVFARERDRLRAAPHDRVLQHLGVGSVVVGRGLIASGAALGAVLFGGIAAFAAWLLGMVAGGGVTPPVVAAGVAGALGALLGAIALRSAGRVLEREVNSHVDRGRIVSLIGAEKSGVSELIRSLEREGALEAFALPGGIMVKGPTIAVLPRVTFRGELHEEEGFGATIVAGHADLPAVAAHLEDVSVALIGRDGHAGPVHSSTAGPGWIHAPPPDGGEGWWRRFVAHYGRPIHLRLVDGELVLLGDARRIAHLLAGHRNDTVSSALARLVERFGCPDASARIVTDLIDGGELGVVLLGSLEARRQGVERLSDVAVATTEGSPARPAERVAA